MAWDASFQAMPENCDLMIALRDGKLGDGVVELGYYTDTSEEALLSDPMDIIVHHLIQALLTERPGLQDRFFRPNSQCYDAIIYLLCPERREEYGKPETSLIYQAIYGQERLYYAEETAPGNRVGLVTAKQVKITADYLDQITLEMLHEHYDPANMDTYEIGVYKVFHFQGEERFEDIWAEFVGMREVYRAAANHDEAIITFIH